ncbi:lipoprotein [Streptomyces sp. VB1]|uniref:lipoprotein n=1 Tax=Streptomyces sp. VB1 TaxID=2986803 RepID=UPI002242A29D|nr:lipoprotein [Streptomyces sp. VB1]UZI30727.1 lipoprotein [Streptomyces sp. VB1]
MTMARGTVRGLVPAVLAAVTLAGCSSSSGAGDGSPGAPAVSSATAKASAEAGAEKTGADKAGADEAGADQAGAGATKAAEKGGRVGGAGSACELPVSFDIAAHWKPRGASMDLGSELDPELAEELADLAEQGTVKVVCEIDAKPAGHIGFLRVWQGEASEDDPRAVLQAFVADDPNAVKAAYTQVTAGALAAAEVGYTSHSELLDEPKKERAFAVATPDGPVVVHLGGMDSEEHMAMLPAFELAKRTLKLG